MELSQTLLIHGSSQRLRREDGISKNPKKNCAGRAGARAGEAAGAAPRPPPHERARAPAAGPCCRHHGAPCRPYVNSPGLLGPTQRPSLNAAPPSAPEPASLAHGDTLELLKSRHSVCYWHLFSCWRWRDAQRGSTWSQASRYKWCALLHIYLHSLYVPLPLSDCHSNVY